MSWTRLMEIIEQESDIETCRRIEKLAVAELGGKKITIGSKRRIVDAEIIARHNGNAKKTAAELGISVSKVYQVLQRRSILIR